MKNDVSAPSKSFAMFRKYSKIVCVLSMGHERFLDIKSRVRAERTRDKARLALETPTDGDF